MYIPINLTSILVFKYADCFVTRLIPLPVPVNPQSTTLSGFLYLCFLHKCNIHSSLLDESNTFEYSLYINKLQVNCFVSNVKKAVLLHKKESCITQFFQLTL
jgi:hypothetical protein